MNNCINNYNIYNRAEYGRKEKKASRPSSLVAFLLGLCEALITVFENAAFRTVLRAVLAIALVVLFYFFVGAVVNCTIGAFRAVCLGIGIVVVSIRVFGVRASD